MLVDEGVLGEHLERCAARAAHQLGEAVALLRGGAATVAAQGDRLGPDGEHAARALQAGATRAQRFVDDLLDLAAAGRAADEATCALDDALDEACRGLAGELAGVELRRDPLPRAAIGPAPARRLFAHLLRSALAARARHLELRAALDDGTVVVELRDDGAPPADPVQVLEPFSEPRGRGALVGAGVSLQVARRIAEVHGGGVAVAVQPDERTAVTVTLPGAP